MKRKKILIAVSLIVPALTVWGALWFMGTGALMSASELTARLGPAFQNSGLTFVRWPVLPNTPTLAPLVCLVLDSPEFFVMFWNTCLQVFPQIVGQVLVGAPAAWAFSRLQFPGRRFLFGAYIVLMLLPFQVTMVPHYLVLNRLGFLDTPLAIICPGIFSTFPVFIMTKGFDAVSRSMLEAAALDGAGYGRTFWSIGLPLGMPGILAALVLGFLEAWNAVEQPMTFLKDPSNWPLSLYLPQTVQEQLSLAMVSGLVALTPAVFMFLFGQKYLELGIQASGLKE